MLLTPFASEHSSSHSLTDAYYRARARAGHTCAAAHPPWLTPHVGLEVRPLTAKKPPKRTEAEALFPAGIWYHTALTLRQVPPPHSPRPAHTLKCQVPTHASHAIRHAPPLQATERRRTPADACLPVCLPARCCAALRVQLGGCPAAHHRCDLSGHGSLTGSGRGGPGCRRRASPETP